MRSLTAWLWYFGVLCVSPLAAAESSQEAPVGHSIAFGEAAPFHFLGGSHRWNWVAGCQPRPGRPQVTLGMERSDWPWMGTYLWTSNGKGELIDAFVAQSPNGRYAAYVDADRLLVYDAKSKERTDLTLFGAVLEGGDRWGALWTQLAFSFGNMAAFRRDQGGVSQLVAIDLETRVSSVLYETHDQIVEFWFDEDGHHFIVTESPRRKHVQPRESSPLSQWQMRGRCGAPRGCLIASPRNTVGVKVTRVSVAALDDAEEREERIAADSRCFPDSRYAIAHSSMGGWLVGFRESQAPDDAFRTVGPVQWVSSFVAPDPRNCVEFGRERRPVPRVRPGEHPQASAGINVLTGIWYFNPRALNESLRAQGYSSTGVSHPAYGGELSLNSGRYRGTLSILGVNSKNVSHSGNPSATSTIYGLALGLSAAYSALRVGRVTLMPEVGIKVLALELESPKAAPALAMPAGSALPNEFQLESAGFLFDVALREEVRILRLARSLDTFTYLTLGSYFGWEQQFASGDWYLNERDTKVSVAHPRVNRSGPLGLLYLGVTFERF